MFSMEWGGTQLVPSPAAHLQKTVCLNPRFEYCEIYCLDLWPCGKVPEAQERSTSKGKELLPSWVAKVRSPQSQEFFYLNIKCYKMQKEKLFLFSLSQWCEKQILKYLYKHKLRFPKSASLDPEKSYTHYCAATVSDTIKLACVSRPTWWKSEISKLLNNFL